MIYSCYHATKKFRKSAFDHGALNQETIRMIYQLYDCNYSDQQSTNKNSDNSEFSTLHQLVKFRIGAATDVQNRCKPLLFTQTMKNTWPFV